MIWNDYQLTYYCLGAGLVTPYDDACINPASIDLRIGNEFISLSNGQRFTADEVTLIPGMAILATTVERVCIPNDQNQVGPTEAKA